jgi:glycosyltransferase involved in cell wall biosynthesis
MDISVIICTWNNSKRLAFTLDSLSKCHVPSGVKWELVLVDNNCTEGIGVVVEQFKEVLPLVYLKELEQGKSRALNTGLKFASGRWIIFTDDDVILDSDWINTYWEAFQTHLDGYFFGGLIESEFEGQRPDDQLLEYAPCSVKGLSYGIERRKLALGEIFLGANWGAKKSDLIKAGMFNVSLGLNAKGYDCVQVGEETELMSLLRKEALEGLYLPNAKIKHWVPVNKCTLEHITSRCEAGAVAHWHVYSFRFKNLKLGSIHFGLYLQIIIKSIKFFFVKLVGGKSVKEYVNLKVFLGILKGFYASRKA